MVRVDVSIIIVNYKVKDLVIRLLESIYDFTKNVSFEIFVIDNASEDGVGDAVKTRFPEVNLILNKENLGFAKACNQGMHKSNGRHVLLLNPDTELISDSVTDLVHFADTHTSTGVVGSKILNSNRSVQSSVFGFPTICSHVLSMMKLHHVIPNARCVREYFQKDFDHSKNQEVDQVMGSVFLITERARKEVGIFDEQYFVWFEEVDYCKRVKKTGLNVEYFSDTSIIHHGGQSFGQVFSLKKQRYFNSSLAKYMKKHHGTPQWLIIKLLHIPSLALAWIVGALGVSQSQYS